MRTQIPTTAHARHQVRDQIGARRGGERYLGEICDRGNAVRGRDPDGWLSENPEREGFADRAVDETARKARDAPHAAGAKDVCARLLVGRCQRVHERPRGPNHNRRVHAPQRQRDVVHRAQDRGHILTAIRRDASNHDRPSRWVRFVGEPMLVDEQLASDLAGVRAVRQDDRHIITKLRRKRRGEHGVAGIQRHGGVAAGEGERGIGDQGDRVGDQRSNGSRSPVRCHMAARDERQRGRRRVGRVDEARRVGEPRRTTVHVCSDLASEQDVERIDVCRGLLDLRVREFVELVRLRV